MTTQKSHDSSGYRLAIIQATKTPLGFFSLVVLVVEVILGITANLSQGEDRTYLVIGMLVLIFLLVFYCYWACTIQTRSTNWLTSDD